MASWILALFGYVPNAIQTADSILGIELIASLFAAQSFFLGWLDCFSTGLVPLRTSRRPRNW
jgi:Na+/melibiose symporter-like transporter